jgi:hypothetical protein
MSLMNEYIARKLSVLELEGELRNLIKEYNQIRKSYLFVYASANGNNGNSIPDSIINMDDHFIIHDMLRNCSSKNLDFYIETPGGSGEAAEEIVRCTRRKFDNVSFVVSGEAKSAGTIIVLSGDEILMTKSGSLGPIDAQVSIGRSRVSAYDYMEWVEEKRKDADATGKLNSFDATMIAQISPGELNGVMHSLKFAEDLVKEWLPKYKFKNWNVTQTKKIPVTSAMKESRATEIAAALTNHRKWRSHGRSIKIDDLENIGVIITKIDDNPKLADVVYRIQTVLRMIFNSSSIYKLYATEEEKISKQAAPIKSPPTMPSRDAHVIETEIQCPKCQHGHKLYLKFLNDPKIDKDEQAKGNLPFPKGNKLFCKKCHVEIDLSGMKNDIEQKIGKKAIA